MCGRASSKLSTSRTFQIWKQTLRICLALSLDAVHSDRSPAPPSLAPIPFFCLYPIRFDVEMETKLFVFFVLSRARSRLQQRAEPKSRKRGVAANINVFSWQRSKRCTENALVDFLRVFFGRESARSASERTNQILRLHLDSVTLERGETLYFDGEWEKQSAVCRVHLMHILHSQYVIRFFT